MLTSLSPNLMVKSVEETIAWYSKYLDAKTTNSVPHQQKPGILQWASVQVGKVEFMFQEQSNLVADYPNFAGREIGGTLSLFIQVEDIDALYAKFSGYAKITTDMHTTFYGMREFVVEDCNGYVLTFAQPEK